MFPPVVEKGAFRARNGELGWTRSQIPAVVEVLRSRSLGILGGELWLVRDGDEDWTGLIPQRHGPPGVYTWETERGPNEEWEHFVDRGIARALVEVERWPTPQDLPPELPGRILYNLTWTSEAEYDVLAKR